MGRVIIQIREVTLKDNSKIYEMYYRKRRLFSSWKRLEEIYAEGHDGKIFVFVPYSLDIDDCRAKLNTLKVLVESYDSCRLSEVLRVSKRLKKYTTSKSFQKDDFLILNY